MSKFSRKSLMMHIVRLMLLVPLASALWGCVADTFPEDSMPASADPAATYTIAFDITIDKPSSESPTRAPQGDYETGSEWENYIDLSGSDYRILFFSHDPYVEDADYYIGKLENVELTLIAENVVAKTYKVTGRINGSIARELMENIVKIGVLANWGSYSGTDEITESSMLDTNIGTATTREGSVITLSDIWENAMFDFTRTLEKGADGEIYQAPLRLNNLIPLYGITNPIEGVRFDGNRYYYAGTIQMLRAFAKVEIVQAEGSFDIDDVRLRRFCKTGYSLPYSYRTQDAYLKGSYAGDYSQTPHVLAGNSTVDDGAVHLNQSDYYTWYIYVPEFANRGKTDSYQTSIEIKFRDFDHYETLHFSKYILQEGRDVSLRGDDFDLLRNNLYRFQIFKNLQVRVDVIPYTGIELNPEFGFDDPLPRPPEEGEMPPWVVVDPDNPK